MCVCVSSVKAVVTIHCVFVIILRRVFVLCSRAHTLIMYTSHLYLCMCLFLSQVYFKPKSFRNLILGLDCLTPIILIKERENRRCCWSKCEVFRSSKHFVVSQNNFSACRASLLISYTNLIFVKDFTSSITIENRTSDEPLVFGKVTGLWN